MATPTGLTAREVASRVDDGKVNVSTVQTSRTFGQIVRANLFTRFNAILGVLLAVILVVGPIHDGLFGIVLVANVAIGIIQEVRAKRTLDRLTLLAAPRATVVRDGHVEEMAVEELVLDDVVALRPGGQIVVDAEVIEATGLEVDESLLTGESEPQVRRPGDEVLSGSFVSAGSGWSRAVRVGPDAYAARLAHQARRFTLVRSDLRSGIDRILQVVTWVIVPTAALLVTTQLLANPSIPDAIRGSVAGVGSMVPEGLVLLASVAMAVSVLRLARRNVLIQELAAVETLARVDTVCLDKTGTLTQGVMRVTATDILDSDAPVAAALGALTAIDPEPNATLRAVATAYPAPEDWHAEEVVPFSSARKWSAASFGARGSWVLGAPDVLAVDGTDSVIASARQGGERAAAGSRVLLLARSPGAAGVGAPAGGGEDIELPTGLEAVALVILEDLLRPDAAETLAFFERQGVTLKVISGDNPVTVAAIAARVGLVGSADGLDARHLPDDPEALADVAEATTVFGRVQPRQKQALVAALQSRGHVVAMTGDGVNDVLALKDADIGVALGAGSSAARAVAQLVLLDNSFSSLPAVVAEGRRVIANVERVANLFVTKTVYATLLAVAVGVAQLPFPFLPRQLTVISSLTIGIPAFLLALAPNTDRARPGFLHRVASFALPVGTVAAAATFVAYALTRAEDVGLPAARTSATCVLCAIGLWVLALLYRPLTRLRRLLLVAMAAAFLVVIVVPGLRAFYGLSLPPIWIWTQMVVIAVVAGLSLETGAEVVHRWSRWRTARTGLAT
ncbi:MAG: HAD-IC family P-type ATPase [Actinomycetota bacterium]|nr:HAD-IC family P-type ATPase [Actinomycetota bacterium]